MVTSLTAKSLATKKKKQNKVEQVENKKKAKS
jgi:hypothetical protein